MASSGVHATSRLKVLGYCAATKLDRTVARSVASGVRRASYLRSHASACDSAHTREGGGAAAMAHARGKARRLDERTLTSHTHPRIHSKEALARWRNSGSFSLSHSIMKSTSRTGRPRAGAHDPSHVVGQLAKALVHVVRRLRVAVGHIEELVPPREAQLGPAQVPPAAPGTPVVREVAHPRQHRV